MSQTREQAPLEAGSVVSCWEASCVPVSLLRANILGERNALGSLVMVQVEVQTRKMMELRQSQIDPTSTGLCGVLSCCGFCTKGLICVLSQGRSPRKQAGPGVPGEGKLFCHGFRWRCRQEGDRAQAKRDKSHNC